MKRNINPEKIKKTEVEIDLRKRKQPLLLGVKCRTFQLCESVGGNDVALSVSALAYVIDLACVGVGIITWRAIIGLEPGSRASPASGRDHRLPPSPSLHSIASRKLTNTSSKQ